MKNADYFCHPETFFGRTRQFTSSYICEHPVYKSYHLVADLKHDWEKFLSEKSDNVLDKVLNSAPKKYRTIKANENPLIIEKNLQQILMMNILSSGMKSYKLEPNSLRIIEKKYQTDFVIL